jgi:hypothetical protein
MPVKSEVNEKNSEELKIGSVWEHPRDKDTVYVLIGRERCYSAINAVTFESYWDYGCATMGEAVNGLVRSNRVVKVEFSS